MIVDILARADAYLPLHPALAAAFAFLRDPGLASLDEGRRPIDG